MGNTNEAEALKSIAMPFPPYNAQNPTLWFQQIESCFYCTGVKDEMIKYHILVSRLEPSVAELIQDFLAKDSSESTDKYSQLKTEIIGIQKTKNDLENQNIGDRKPSEFLKHLQQLAKENSSFPTDLVRSIWIASMSPYVKNVLLTDPTVAVQKLGFLADILHVEEQRKSQQKAEASPDKKHCRCCSQEKKVTLEVKCVKLCEVMENMGNIDLKKIDTCENSTQTTLW